jgi:hypothetical protein
LPPAGLSRGRGDIRPRFKRGWGYYLSHCEAGFRAGALNVARRRLLSGGAALAAFAPDSGTATPPDIRFEVLRNDTNIGQHVVTFRQDNDSVLASAVVDIAVRLGPIVLYHYKHSMRETWRGDEFVQLDSETDDNGKAFQVHAVRSEEHVVVESPQAPRRLLPPATIPLTHWNILCMRRPLFNPQDGVPIDSIVEPRGETTVALADGKMVHATRYSVVGKYALDDWYDDAHQWTAFRTIGRDGSTIDYRRVA